MAANANATTNSLRIPISRCRKRNTAPTGEFDPDKTGPACLVPNFRQQQLLQAIVCPTPDTDMEQKLRRRSRGHRISRTLTHFSHEKVPLTHEWYGAGSSVSTRSLVPNEQPMRRSRSDVGRQHADHGQRRLHGAGPRRERGGSPNPENFAALANRRRPARAREASDASLLRRGEGTIVAHRTFVWRRHCAGKVP